MNTKIEKNPGAAFGRTGRQTVQLLGQKGPGPPPHFPGCKLHPVHPEGKKGLNPTNSSKNMVQTSFLGCKSRENVHVLIRAQTDYNCICFLSLLCMIRCLNSSSVLLLNSASQAFARKHCVFHDYAPPKKHITMDRMSLFRSNSCRRWPAD